MSGEWCNTTLGEIINLKRGYDLPSSKRKPGMFPIYSSSGLSGYHDEYQAGGNGVVTGRYGTIGEVFFVDRPYWPLNTTLYVQDFKGNDPKFIYYFLKTINFQSFSDKSAVPGINRNHVHLLDVSIPTLDEQRAIAATLSCLDDKIELNNRINKTLEQMAQAIFKSWFVDFVTTKPFTDIVQVLGGGTPKTGNDEFWGGAIPFFTPKDVDGTYVLSTEKTLTESGLESCNSRLYPVDTVFVTARGTVGKIALAGAPMAMNQSCYALVGKAGYGQYFVYNLALNVVAQLKNKASGAVFDAIVTRDFESEQVPFPSPDEVQTFEGKVAPIYEAILNNIKQSARLATLRDTLLPGLMNAEITIPMELEND